MRRILVLLVAVGALVVPAAAAAPTSGGTERTLEPGWNMRWLSAKAFKPRQALRITVWVDDVGIDLRGRLPLRLYQTVDGVRLFVRSPLYPDGRRLSLLAGNGRADPVTIKLRWRIPCRPAVEACEAPPPIAICDCPPEGDCDCGGGEDVGDVRRVRP